MMTRTCWLACLLAVGVALAPAAARGQEYEVPPLTEPVFPLPLGHDRMEKGGFFADAEFIFWRQTNPIKHQTIAIRGFDDVDGTVQLAINVANGTPNGQVTPGAFFGTARPALDASQVSGPVSYTPGFAMGLGWRFEDGLTVQLNWHHLVDVKYSAVASIIPPTFNLGQFLSDSFLFSPVFNFPNAFAGPTNKIGISTSIAGSSAASATTILNPLPETIVLPNGTVISNIFLPVGVSTLATSAGFIIVPQAAFGIWNGASIMDLVFVQRYDDFELLGRVPIYQTECCRCYGLVGPRIVQQWERFTWRTTAVTVSVPPSTATATATFTQNLTGNVPNTTITMSVAAGLPAPVSGGAFTEEDVAIYSNVVSNRMYGPMVGWGTDYYVGHGFSGALELRAGCLIDVVKERAKYERADRAISSQRSKSEYTVVPELDAIAYVTWYPIEGVELRAGYDLFTFFNTVASPRPVSFNYGGLDPPWEKGTFRMIDGFQAGIALIF
jgi:hypothetical protein